MLLLPQNRPGCKPMPKMLEKKFNIAPLINNGRPILQIRRHIVRRTDIDAILKEILTRGEIRILAIVRFRDKFTARRRLKELGIFPDLNEQKK